LGTSTRALQQGARPWIEGILEQHGLQDMPLMVSNRRSAANALYFYGECRGRCKDPRCTLRVRAHVYLDGHKTQPAGHGMVTVLGEHPPDGDPGVDAEAPLCPAAELPPLQFSLAKRGGMLNVRNQCFLNSSLQMLLTAEPVVRILRTKTRLCLPSRKCVVCLLALADRHTAEPDVDATKAFHVFGLFADWCRAYNFENRVQHDAGEALNLIMESLKEVPEGCREQADRILQSVSRRVVSETKQVGRVNWDADVII